MDDYISREAAIAELCRHFDNTDVKLFYPGVNNAVSFWLNSVPAADVRPVVHTKTENALDTVRAERDRQNSLWGDQRNIHLFEWISILGEEYGELCAGGRFVNRPYGTRAAGERPYRIGQARLVRTCWFCAYKKTAAIIIIAAVRTTIHKKQ